MPSYPNDAIALKDQIALILAALAFVFSIFMFLLNYKRGSQAAVVSRMPVLVFEYGGATGWILRNVGNGPAMNVIVAQRLTTGEWLNPVRIPPLAKDGVFVPSWLGHVNTTGLGATYNDTDDLPYTSVCRKDLSSVEAGAKIGPWPEESIGKHGTTRSALNERAAKSDHRRPSAETVSKLKITRF